MITDNIWWMLNKQIMDNKEAIDIWKMLNKQCMMVVMHNCKSRWMMQQNICVH